MIATFVRSVTVAYLPSGENSSMPGDSSNGIDFTIFRVDGSTMISALGPSMSTPDQLCDGACSRKSHFPAGESVIMLPPI